MKGGKRIKVVLVDDHRIVLDGLVSLLENDPDFIVLAALGSGEEVIEFIKKDPPDILLTDYTLPGISGLEVTRIVKRDYPQTKVVALSMHDESHLVKSMLKEGVDGYLLKNIQQFELKNAIKQVILGMPYVSPEITRLLMHDVNHPAEEQALLTDRERDILRLIAKEYSNKKMADELFISERTVETHRKNIFRKTNTTSLVGLIKYAYEHKLI
ncbi:MAG TPA: response regulator transcription factor [Cyclobacteriaceae bacterium]|nr:response regulator transcription factor [Cyclobacteriaceae bacterium]